MSLFRFNPCKVKTGYRNYIKENLEETMSLLKREYQFKRLKVDMCSSNYNPKQKETVETYFQDLSEILEK